MGKFDHLDKLQVEAELRKLEPIPRKFWGADVEELRARYAAILEQERQAEGTDIERRHRELLEHSQKELSTSVVQHQETLSHYRLSSWIAAAIAAVSALAAVCSVVYSHVQTQAALSQAESFAVQAALAAVAAKYPASATPESAQHRGQSQNKNTSHTTTPSPEIQLGSTPTTK